MKTNLYRNGIRQHFSRKREINRSDAIREELRRIYVGLDREARADRCAGDIVCGWDWPTLCAVRPLVAERISNLKREWRALMSVGL